MIAGTASTVLFAAANVPMLARALRTRDLESYSVPSLVTINAGNLLHTAYVVSLPLGPVWFLHGFYLVSMAVMGALAVRARRRRARGIADHSQALPQMPAARRRLTKGKADARRPARRRAPGSQQPLRH